MTRKAIDDITPREREAIAAQMAQLLAREPEGEEPTIAAPVLRCAGDDKRWERYEHQHTVFVNLRRGVLD